MIELKDITWDNFWEVINLEPKDDQKPYVKPVSVFMAQSYINLKEGYKDTSLALYDGSSLVGFTKIVFVPKAVKPYYLNADAYMIDALIIDQTYQRKGYAKVALSKIIDYCTRQPFERAKNIVLVCHKKNLIAQALFKDFAFEQVPQNTPLKTMNLYSRILA